MRIDTGTKERAAEALEAMGLSISDAIRLLLLRAPVVRAREFEIYENEIEVLAVRAR